MNRGNIKMNKERRKNINNTIEKLREINETISIILEEEEIYRDNMPENLQNSEKYEKADQACDNLQECIDELESIIDMLEIASE